MRGYLLDTNVLSELLRKRPFPRVLDHLRQVSSDQLCTSSICVMELRYGAARHPEGSALWERISDEVLPRVQILPVGQEEAARAGDLLARFESQGNTIGLEDILIGATALANDLTAVTRNVRHFSRIKGLVVESWWE